MFGALQNLIVFVVSAAALVGAVWALVDASRYPNEAYVAAGKQTKVLWVAVLGVASAIALVSLPWPPGRGGQGILGFLGIATVAAVIFYFVGVQPKLREHHRPGSTGGSSNRSGW